MNDSVICSKCGSTNRAGASTQSSDETPPTSSRTSRAPGKGTGLGLAIVKHIVNRHRGRLAVESSKGEGSTFTVILPAVAEEPAVKIAV